MQSLDLSGSSKKSDGRLKSLLWPAVDNAWDVDYLGQQGFWICLVIGVLSFIFVYVFTGELGGPAGHRIGLIVAIAMFVVYFIGGMGVRESSWPAAAMVFAIYAVNLLGSGNFPGVLAIIAGAVLLSNVRATVLASRWKPAAEGEDRPMRFNETLRDKLVDQLPPRAWPILRIPFFILASVLLLFLLYGSALALSRPRAAPAPNQDSPSGPGQSSLLLPAGPIFT